MNTKDQGRSTEEAISGNVSTERALDLALEALKMCRGLIRNNIADGVAISSPTPFFSADVDAAITAIKQARSAPVQEPSGFFRHEDVCGDEVGHPTPYYLAPPAAQRQWIGLTDEEMRELEKQFEAERVRTSDEEYLVIYPAAYWQWQRAIEAKLKEKNT